MRGVVVDLEAMLQVLAGVREVQAVEHGLAAGGGVGDARVQPDDVAAEGDHDGLEARVPADQGGLLRGVHRVALPVLDGHEGELRAVADQQLDVGGAGTGAGVVQHHDGLGERLDVDHHVGEADPALGVHVDLDRLGQHRVLRDRDDQRLLEGAERLRGDPVDRLAGLAQAGVVAADGLGGDAVGQDGLDLVLARGALGGAAVVQAVQAVQRGEPPVLLAAGGHREVVHVERGLGRDAGVDRLLHGGTAGARTGKLRAGSGGAYLDRSGGRGAGGGVDVSHGCRSALFLKGSRLDSRSGLVSRRSPPSAARSAGSAPARTPSGARGRSARRSHGRSSPSPRTRSGPGSSGRRAGRR